VAAHNAALLARPGVPHLQQTVVARRHHILGRVGPLQVVDPVRMPDRDGQQLGAGEIDVRHRPDADAGAAATAGQFVSGGVEGQASDGRLVGGDAKVWPERDH